MGNIRLALTNKDFGEETGTPIYCPQFSHYLLDDIEKMITINEGYDTWIPEMYSYLLYDYPDSHHID